MSRRRSVVALALAAFAALAALSAVAADSPPIPDFFWPYGKALVNGANLVPAQQTVVGIVNNRACGVDKTLVATASPGTPADDVGKTVYVVNILADGTASGQQKGCGHPGDPVIIYFPESHRVGFPQATFQQGGQRVDLNLGPELSFRQLVPLASSDGIY
jgi:hypothetical protein